MASKGQLPTADEVLRYIQRHIDENGGIEDKDERDALLRGGLLVPKYTQGLREDEIKEMVTKLRRKLSSVCSSHCISEVVEVKWHKQEIKSKFGLEDLFLQGPNKVFPREFLKKRGIELGNESEEESEEEEQNASTPDKQHLTRGNKRGAEDPPSDMRKRQKSSDSGIATPSKAAARAFPAGKLPIRGATPSSSRTASNGVTAVSQADRLAIRKGWAIEADVREEPVVLPTKKPVNPAEILPASDQGWVKQQMEDIYQDIWNATLAVFQEYKIDENATPDFMPEPGPELLELYDTLFNTPEWKKVWFELRMEEKAKNISQEYAILALQGAAIFKWVFQKELAWDMSKEVTEALGETATELLGRVISDLGHDFKTVLKYATGKQIVDESFREQKVAVRAQEMAESLALILLPHLERAAKAERAADSVRYDPWIESVKEAFQKAIIMRQTLHVSKLGPFHYIWARPEEKFVEEFHQPVHPEHGVRHVMTPVLPGVVRLTSERPIVYHKIKVVPMATAG
ncbi:Hypothetical predicted protein [Lecanosticta acicola]|uniref:Uncharacterized protein n=1 Tax=Lecanosticta acicola TaxID=111012 RepID=A0AAI8Z0G4_9PEZI|nr:Hypothetical predicted protein [Lecanosticta acicola]